MTQMLTFKQESFAQVIVDGLNQSDAYRHAYNASNMKPETIWQRASEVMEHGQVAVRIQELRSQITAGKAWSFARGMDEVETNIRLARAVGQMGPARTATRDALEMSRLLDPKAPDQQVTITKVTVVLNHGNRDRELPDPSHVVGGEARTLPGDEADHDI